MPPFLLIIFLIILTILNIVFIRKFEFIQDFKIDRCLIYTRT